MSQEKEIYLSLAHHTRALPKRATYTPIPCFGDFLRSAQTPTCIHSRREQLASPLTECGEYLSDPRNRLDCHGICGQRA
jgi:hypothetical protein